MIRDPGKYDLHISHITSGKGTSAVNFRNYIDAPDARNIKEQLGVKIVRIYICLAHCGELLVQHWSRVGLTG